LLWAQNLKDIRIKFIFIFKRQLCPEFLGENKPSGGISYKLMKENKRQKIHVSNSTLMTIPPQTLAGRDRLSEKPAREYLLGD